MTLSVFQSSVVNNSGDVQGGAEIEVVNEANGLPATLYSTRAGAVTTNPIFADADGFFRFYTEAGEYRITATSGPFSKTFRYVRVGDAGGKDASRVARGGDFMTYGGSANAITLTSVNTLPSSSIQAGDKFRFKATTTNTGTTTITVDGGPTLTCKTPTGANLPAGFIRTDVFTECEYDGASFVVSRKVESGSDVNGEWTRWENGLMTQNGEITVTTSNLANNFFGTTSGAAYSGDGAVTFPLVFQSIRYAKAATKSVSSNLAISDRSMTISGFSPRIWGSSDGTVYDVTWFAEGSWY